MYERTREQFGRAAEAYNRSASFAWGEDLGWLVEAAAPDKDAIALDLGTAAGHAAFAMASHVRMVLGLDITPPMIRIACRNAEDRRLHNFHAVLAGAERLPHPDACFDLVVCRYAAHHFHDPARVLKEVARVLRPGGRFVVIDSTAPDDPELDQWINHVEQLRDPSHVKEWNAREWRGFFSAAGLSFEMLRTWLHPLEFEDWTARQQTPPERVAALRALFAEANPAARRAFAIEGFRFALLTGLMRGVKVL